MSSSTLSKAEAELYDRQIRLWGIESQEKLKAANVLLINVRGLGSEIAKNILLCGINSLTILDSGVVTDEEINKNFLLNKNCVGKNIAEAVLLNAQELNPLVKINVDTAEVSGKIDEFFERFTLVVATNLTTKEIFRIDNICSNKKIKFICGDVFGMFGYSILNLQEHEFIEERVSYCTVKRDHEGNLVLNSDKIINKVQQKITYPNIEEVFQNETLNNFPRLRKTLYYLVRVLMEFRDKNDRNPSYENWDDDIIEMRKIKENYIEKYKVFPEKLTNDMLNLVFGEVPPVCSILGGVMAQEVIKAVSHKDAPVHNVFLLDPYTYSGSEFKVVNYDD